MTKEEQYFELNTNSEIIEEIIGYKPKAISYPSNSYNKFTIEILKKLKINYGFRANDQINLDPYELARIDATYIIDRINSDKYENRYYFWKFIKTYCSGFFF